MSGLGIMSGPPRPRGRGGPSLPSANMDIREYFNYGLGNAGWQVKPELPMVNEIMGTDHPGEEFNLTTNQIHGPWSSTEQYLETHHNLLREDGVGNLRDAVAAFRERPGAFDNKTFVIYERVFFTRVTMAHRGMAFRVCFSTRRAGKKIIWKYSSRLLTGKIVALSPANDLFSSKCVVAVVAARPLEGVSKNPPEVDLFFAHPDDMDFDPLKQWVMIEARSGYYEAHRYTMTALQKLSRERFPLSHHICGLDTQIDVPEYIISKPKMDFRAFAPAAIDSRQELLYDVIDQLDSAPLEHLNRYQQDAMRHMLANKLAIVQGPPGTGKTFVSVTFLRLLIAQMRRGDPPIIVATHTNHALDQLLTHVADFEPNYLRLGGRSKNLRVAARTLFSMKENKPVPNLQNAILPKARQNHTALVTDVIQNTLKGIYRQSADRSGMAFVLHGLLTEEQLNNLEVGSNQWVSYNNAESSSDPFTAWLGRQAQEFTDLYSEEQYSDKVDDCDKDYEMLMEIEAEQVPDADEWESLKGRFVEFRDAFPVFVRGTRTLPAQTMERYLGFRDLWEIPYDHRGAVYKELHNRLVNIVRADLQKKLKIYMLVSKTLQIGKFEYDYEILKTAKVIGMTTTGLSKYRGLVAALKPRIVMIEEAAEVIEAPVAVACFESLQHLILVGDHKQLKGHCAVYDLAGEPYFLDVSMFERLVQNDFPFVMLKEQRRMAPEIRRLLAPIYDDLQDHGSILKHEPVPGMGDVRSFFVTHNWPEVDDSLTSKVNEIEALLVYELYCYLCANGVPSQKITILTFYNGQRKKIRKMLMDNEVTKFQDPTVVTVDSYQGEENDIVILSLVRSKEGPATSIEFLAVDNRVCVALSRARRGLYIFGNARHLVAASELWRQILTIMKAGSGGNPRIGYGIPVTCQHGTITIMRNIGDWKNNNGGCEMICGATLGCKHECPLRCHRFPHSNVKCTRKCEHKQPCCGRQCSGYECWQDHVHSCACIPISTRPTASARPKFLSPPIPPNSRASTDETDVGPLIDFSDNDINATDASLTEKKTTTGVRNNTVDYAPETATLTHDFFESLVANNDPAHKDQERRESKNRWLDFAYGGARVSDRARTSPPKKETDMMDTVEDEMEVSKALTINPKAKKGAEPEEKTASKLGPPQTVPTRHLLD